MSSDLKYLRGIKNHFPSFFSLIPFLITKMSGILILFCCIASTVATYTGQHEPAMQYQFSLDEKLNRDRFHEFIREHNKTYASERGEYCIAYIYICYIDIYICYIDIYICYTDVCICLIGN